jgi:hypothetical protein
VCVYWPGLRSGFCWVINWLTGLNAKRIFDFQQVGCVCLSENVLTLWKQRQSQSHVTTDGQSVSLGVEPPLGLMTRFLVLYNDYYGLCPLGTPFLTERRVCHLSEVCHIFMSCKNIYISIDTIKYVQYVQGLCRSRLCEADYSLSYLTCVMTTASHLNGRRPERRWV